MVKKVFASSEQVICFRAIKVIYLCVADMLAKM